MTKDPLDVFDPTPKELDDIYETVGKRYGLNPDLLKAQNAFEVGPHGGSHTAGDARHVGYGQLGPAVRKYYGVHDATDPKQAIDGQAHYLSDLLHKHDGDLPAALTEYTGGPNQEQWGEHTKAYAANVLKNYSLPAKDWAYPQAQTESAKPDPLDVFPKAPKPNASTVKPGAKAYPWDATKSFVNGLDLGFGPEIHGVSAAARDFLHDVNNGVDFHSALDKFHQNYSAERNWAQQGRTAYSKAEPGTHLGMELAGSAVPTVAALAVSRGAAAPLIEGSLPESTGRFMLGNLAKNPGLKNWLIRRASNVFGGALEGGQAGALQAHMSDRPLGEQIARGAEFGAALNPAIGAGIEPILSAISPITAMAAQKLRNLGVNIPIGAVPGASTVIKTLNRLFGDGGEQAQHQLTAAAARTIGSDSPVLTRDTMNEAEEQLSQRFNQFKDIPEVAKKDPIFKTDLAHVWHNAQQEPLSQEAYGKLHDIFSTIRDAGDKNGVMSGNDYHVLTRRGSLLDKGTFHPEVREHAIAIRDALDDAMERHLGSGYGQWVPSQQAAARTTNMLLGHDAPAASPLLTTTLERGGRGPAPYPNFTGPGVPGEPLEGDVLNAPVPPPGPNMTWEYTPGMEHIIPQFRQARAMWRNLKLLDPLVDDTTGQIDPAKLARAVDRGFKRSSRVDLPQENKDLQTLGSAGDFLGDSPGHSTSGFWSKLMHGALTAAPMAGAVEFMEHGMPSWKEALLAAGAAGATNLAGKAANKLASSDWNTNRILTAALVGEPATAAGISHALIAPGVHLWNEPDQQAEAPY